MNALTRHLRALWQAEMLIVELKLGLFARRSGLMLFGGLIGIFGLGFLNVAGYLALAPLWGEAWAMVFVAFVDFVIAGILVFIASRQARDAEIALATELRDQALEAVELDARIAVDDVTGFVRRPVQVAGSASAVLIPFLSMLIRLWRRSRR